MRILKKIFLVSLAVLMLLLGVGIGLAWYFEGHVQQMIIEELNKRINQNKASLEIERINFSLLKKFPNASIEFDNSVLKIFNSTQSKVKTNVKDTLFNFSKIYLEFSMSDLFEKNYSIKIIEFKNGNLNWKIDKSGNDYMDIWKPSTDTLSNDFHFALHKFILQDCNLTYANLLKGQKGTIAISELFFKGNFSKDQIDVNVDVNAHVLDFVDHEVSYFKDKDIAIETRIRKNQDYYEIQQGKLVVNHQALTLEGSVQEVFPKKNNSTFALDIKIFGNDLQIEGLLNLLPAYYQTQLVDYKSRGELTLISTINGNYSDIESPEVTAKFEIKNGEFTYAPNSITMHSIYLKGSYSNGKLRNPQSNSIEITAFNGQLGKGSVSAKLLVKNFKEPHISFSANGKLWLEDWHEFVPLDSVEMLNGQAAFAFAVSSQFKDSLKLSRLDIDSFLASGDMTVNDFGLHIQNKKLQFDDCQLALSFSENEILVDNLQGKIISSDIKLSGLIQNILPHLINGEKYMITAMAQSNYINLNELLSSPEGGYVLHFPADLSLALQMQANKIEFRKFSATQFSGQFIMNEGNLQANDLSLHAFEGSLQAYASIETRENKQLFVSCHAGIENINMQSLFYQCEDFNQDHIQSQHIKGIATATIDFESMWNDNLTVQADKIYSNIDLTIEKGELINYETLNSLSKFISIEELKHVKFSTLHNTIEIKNQAVYIPEMELHSSALDLSLSGVQTFNNEIEYHFRILLSELLSQKFKKNRKKKSNEEYFGEVEEDASGKASIYISMTRTVDDPKMSFDKKVVLKKAKSDIKSEGENLKSIIKDEYNWRPKDSTKVTPKRKSPSGLLFDWDNAKEEDSENSIEITNDSTSNLSKTQQRRKQAFEEFKNSVFKK